MSKSDLTPQDAPQAARREPIAIIGIGCRFPGGVHDLESFWQLLRDGVDAISEIPASRFDLDTWYDPRPATPGKVMTRFGGFLDQLDEMDADFFGVAPREAERLDPQQRLLMEVAWEALENAGLPVEELSGSQTGVFVGQWLSDFEGRMFADPAKTDFYMTTGSGRYAASGRLSYLFGLQGPSVTIDTACSSSLVAVNLACQSLLTGECRAALAAAANVILQPHITIAYSQSKMMAPDGRCKFGDAGANGYVRSEGSAALVLKRLSDAQADGDPILALIVGSAVNNDGQSSGYLTTPGGAGQEEMLRKAYRGAGIAPSQVQYVEAHGTGTSAGDPVEIGALGAVVGENRPADRPCLVGSVKSNFGHTEGAAGMAGLIKVVLSLMHRQIPPSLHFHTPSPRIPWNELPLRVPDRLQDWPDHDGPAVAGVSAFGITGTNGHVVLQEAPAPAGREPVMLPQGTFLPLSARSPEALRALAGRFAEILADTGAALPDILYTAGQRRSHHAYRLAVPASDREALAEALRAYAQDEPAAPVTVGEANAPRKVVFVFPGQGGQWLGMGRQLLATDPVFRQTIEHCELAFRPLVGWSLLEQMAAEESAARIEEIDVVQPMLFAIQAALADSLRARGVIPAAVVGHSLGEVAAAYAAGALSLEDAARVICTRSRLMRRVSGKGAMAVVGLSLEKTNDLLRNYRDRLSAAVSNSPASTVISGDPQALEEVMAGLRKDNIFCRPVNVDVAAHSPQMEALRPELVAALAQIQPRPADMLLMSTADGGPVDGSALDAHYWGRNLRQPVLFSGAVQHLLSEGYTAFVECGPHPVLLTAVQQNSETSPAPVTLAAMRRNEDELAQLGAVVMGLYVNGAAIDWTRAAPRHGQVISLPNYPWQRKRYWVKEAELGAKPAARAAARLLEAHFEPAGQPRVQIWQAELALEAPEYLADHRVNGAVLLPAAAFLEMALEAASSAKLPLAVSELALEQALPLLEGKHYTVQLTLSGGGRFEIASRADGEDAWTRHAHGTLASLPTAEKLDLALDDVEDRPGKEHVSAMRSRTLEYGPAFQAVTAFSKAGNQLSATVSLPAGLSIGDHVLHPAVLDAAFQLLIGVLNEDDAAGDPFLPVRIARASVFARPSAPQELAVQVTRRAAPSADTLLGDLRLLDASGAVVAAVDGLEMRRLRSAAHTPEALVYALEWAPEAGQAAELARPAAGHWLLASDRADTAEALAGMLRAQGAVCNLHTPGAALPGDLRDVVFLALDRAGEPGAAEAQSTRLLELIQTLAGKEWQKPPRLWLATLGAQAVLPGDSPAPALSALWGLAASAAHEFPGWRVTRVDLDTLENLPALARELLAPQTDPVALRGSQRLTARLARAVLDGQPATEIPTPANGRPFVVETAQPGVLDSLALRAVPPRKLGPGQVEIEVRAAGLNFIDVMKALNIYPGADEQTLRALGLECAGVIRALGEGVSGLQIGQEVLAFAPRSFSNRVIADARLVMPKPARLSFAEAAGIPVVFLTTYYALCYLGRMRRGERVLIHSAAGGVGLAAIQLANHLGAEVFATAGSEEKRTYLRRLGVQHIMDSRSLDFAGQIMEITGGQGVDLVLNSLTGEAIPAGLSILAPYGRFLEIGKRDIYADEHIGLLPFQRNLSYFAIDLNRIAYERPELLGEQFTEVMALIEQDALQPLPVRVFAAAHAADAIRDISRADHIGKIIIAMDAPDALVLPGREETAPVKSEATYLITGGFGALGLTLAGWLAGQGARHLALVGRSGEQKLSSAQRAALESLRNSGVEVVSFAADISAASDAAAVMARIHAEMPPLRGVIHAAGVLDDGILLQQTAERMHTTFAPKAGGAWNLHCLTDGQPLDFFILFSSITGPFGSPGQANYAAANAYLDGLAQQRKAAGLPALSINWGPWGQIGLAAQREEGGLKGLAGLSVMEPQDGLAVFGHLLAYPGAQVIATGLNAAKWVESHPAAGRSSLFTALAALAAQNEAAAEESSQRAKILAAEPGRDRRAVLEEFVQGQAAAVLRLPPARVDVLKPLRSLGMDSLMGIEFRNRLESSLDVTLSATLVWNYPTVNDLVPFLAEKMGIALEKSAPGVPAEAPAAREPELSPDIENLSDDDLAALLDEELKGLDDLL